MWLTLPAGMRAQKQNMKSTRTNAKGATIISPGILFIAQDKRDVDWQGELSLYCSPCVRTGPKYWKCDGYDEWGWQEVDIAKLIMHPRELGNEEVAMDKNKNQR